MEPPTLAPSLAPTKLPDPLPDDPLPMLAAWLDEARRAAHAPNPEAMALATATADARPSARIVLCKGINPERGYALFFTNYASRKSAEIGANPRAAGLFHWDHLGRQARIEGAVERSPAEESDAYFASRPLLSQLGAWASEQSQPLDARFRLLDRLGSVAARFGIGTDPDPSIRVPRPPNWGGYRIWIDAVELWVGGDYRLHDRAVWERTRTAPSHDPLGTPLWSPWTATRRQP
jgi:pyridoxamine 5'-phosphate oxidase